MLLANAPKFYITRVPGQVPSKESMDLMRLAKEEPKPMTVARMLQHDGAYLSPQSVVRDIGLDRAQENAWAQTISDSANGNELTFRQSILTNMLHDRLDPYTRKALFQRAMSYYNDMKKSLVKVYGIDELKKSESEEKALRLYKSIVRKVHKSNGQGIHLSDLRDLISQYGKKAVADTLKKACTKDKGSLRFKKGLLLSR